MLITLTAANLQQSKGWQSHLSCLCSFSSLSRRLCCGSLLGREALCGVPCSCGLQLFERAGAAADPLPLSQHAATLSQRSPHDAEMHLRQVVIAAGARLCEKESQQWPEARRRQLVNQLRARRASRRGCSPHVSPHLAAHPCTSHWKAAVAGHRHAMAQTICNPGCDPHLLTASQRGVMRGCRRPECVAEQL